MAIDSDELDPFLAKVSLAVRAQRRVRRLDQRGLAARAGVSKSTVARIERGDSGITLSMLRTVLAELGLAVALVAKDGRQWPEGAALPADADRAVDRGGRRLPAHLPASLTDGLQSWDFCRAPRPLLPAPTRWRYNRFSDDVEALVEEVKGEAAEVKEESAGRAGADAGGGTGASAVESPEEDAEGAPDC